MNEPTQPINIDITSLINAAATLLTSVLGWSISDPKIPKGLGD